jgi:hypothetical protein
VNRMNAFMLSRHMPKILDTELQARLLRDTTRISEKKRKLEEAIRAADARNKFFIENAAQKDIESFKNGRSISKHGN